MWKRPGSRANRTSTRFKYSDRMWDILDLPVPIQVRKTSYVCMDCKNKRQHQDPACFAEDRNYTVLMEDVKAEFPGLLVYKEKDGRGAHFMTRRFLLHLVQVYYESLCTRETRRRLVDYYTANVIAFNAGGRAHLLLSAVPRPGT